jgi:hypothetical protein
MGKSGNRVFALPACSLHFAKAGSAATLPQQEKNNSVDIQQERANFTGIICTVAS